MLTPNWSKIKPFDIFTLFFESKSLALNFSKISISINFDRDRCNSHMPTTVHFFKYPQLHHSNRDSFVGKLQSSPSSCQPHNRYQIENVLESADTPIKTLARQYSSINAVAPLSTRRSSRVPHPFAHHRRMVEEKKPIYCLKKPTTKNKSPLQKTNNRFFYFVLNAKEEINNKLLIDAVAGLYQGFDSV